MIQIDSLECGGTAVELWVLTPVEEQLTDNACFTTDSLWTYPGPYPGGTGVVLHVVPNFGQPPAQGAFQISGGFPAWTVDIEAGFDNDFNDVNLTVSWMPQQDSVTIILTADTTELRPWIRRTTFTVNDTIWQQDEQPPDTAMFVLTAVAADSTPVPGVEVTLTAEMIPGPGGHVHRSERVSFDDVPLTPTSFGPNNLSPNLFATHSVGKPVSGFLLQGEDSLASLTDTTDVNGEVSFAFVAGFIGTDVDLIATATVGGGVVADTQRVRIRTPDLAPLTSSPLIYANAYFVGGTVDESYTPDLILHPQDSIWYVGSEMAVPMVYLVNDLQRGNKYPQINDASLHFGGAFTVAPDTAASGVRVDNPWRPHGSHGLGVDVDLSTCYAGVSGEDGQVNRVYPPCPGGMSLSENTLEQAALDQDLRLVYEGNPPHYHLRPQSTLTFAGVN
jgi:hypothetical protein